MLQASDLEPQAETHNFPWRKIKINITKCEQCTVETSVNNSFARERVFYHVNERFVSNRTGDIFFDKVFGTLTCNAQGLRNALDNKHLASHRLADATAETQNFSAK